MDPAIQRVSNSIFAYRALTPQRSTIRLVNILPSDDALHGDFDDINLPRPRISCTCTHTLLSPRLRYTALSYTWGDREKTATILLNGQLHSITKNLEQVLLYLRPVDEPMTIWIDALCIDQDNDMEKSEQVQQMRVVYSQAEKVICWVGPPVTGSDAAMEWIRHFGQRSEDLGIGSTPQLYIRNLFRLVHSKQSDELDPSLLTFVNDLRKSLSSKPGFTETTAQALADLVARPYWGRIWIVQEIASGRKLDFRCGNLSVTETQMHRATLVLRNLRRIDELNLSGWDDPKLTRILASIRCGHVVNNFKIRRAAQPLQMIYLIRAVQTFQASDGRDAIFALLNVAADRADLGLIADYTLNSTQVFIRTTFALLNHGYMDILPRHPTHHLPETGLPSWCRDFSKTKPPIPTLQERALDRVSSQDQSSLQPSFRAAGSYGDANLHKIQLLDSSRLRLRAIPIGQVLVVAPSCDVRNNNLLSERFETLSKLYLARPPLSNSPDALLESLVRTAVADQEIRQGPSKPRLSPSLLKTAAAFLSSHRDESGSWTSLNPKADLESLMTAAGGLNDYLFQLREICKCAPRAFRTERGIGVGPKELEQGDWVYAVPGSEVPLAFRKGDDGGLELVGEVYLDGAMDGEMLEEGGGKMGWAEIC